MNKIKEFRKLWKMARGPKSDRDDDGLLGNNGLGLKTTNVTYGLSDSDSTQPTNWTSQPPALIKGKYLWTKIVWTYTDSSSETGYQKTYIDKDGNNGSDGIAGKGITISDLVAKINEWADERNLKQADPKIQWMRVTEEVGEIRDVLLKPTKFTDPQIALKDAIGDTLVTIIVLAHQLDLDVTECLNIAYEEIKNRKGKMINGTFVKEEDL